MHRVPSLSKQERLTLEQLLHILENAGWDAPDLAGEDISDLDLSAPVLEAQWRKRGFAPDRPPPWWSPADPQRNKPPGLHLYRAYMEATVLRRTRLPGADLRWANLIGAAGGGADLSAALLEGAHLQGASFKGAKFVQADLSHIEGELAFFGETIMTEACFQEARLERAEFINADLRGADFRGALLTGVLFNGADLRGADLREADLRGAQLADALLAGARLEGARLDDVDMSRVRWSR